MIKSFGNIITRQIYHRKKIKGLSDDVQRCLHRKLEILEQAEKLNDLALFPGSNLKQLGNNLWGIDVNDEGSINFEMDKNKFTNVRLKRY